MKGLSGRYDETFRPPRGGLADKYRATRAPTKKPNSVADSDVTFSWVNDVDIGKSRKEEKSQEDLGNSRRGELSNWNGMGATNRGRDYDFTGNAAYDNNVVRAKPPSGNPQDHAMAQKPPTGSRRVRHDRRPENPSLLKKEQTQDGYLDSGESWRDIALSRPGDDGIGWGTMFGRMQIRWSGREQRKQAMAFATLARQDGMGGRGHTERSRSDYSREGSFKPDHQRRKRVYTFILASVLLLVVAVAIVIPTVIFTRKDNESSEEALDSFLNYNFQAKSPNSLFEADMNDPTSEEYINIAQEFCSEIENKVTTNYSEQYAGCVVTRLQNGSIIFIFSIFLVDSPAIPSPPEIRLTIAGTTNPNETFQVGKFTLTVESLVLNSTSVSTTADFTNVTCLAPSPVENGNWSYSGVSFSNTAMLTCNNGYEIQGEATITCTRRYQWSSRPNCTEIICVNYTLPTNSNIEPSTPNGLTYNTNITVTCNPGFDLTGDGVVNCMADGNWSTSPTCNIKSCPNFTIPENSQISPIYPATVYNSFYAVICDEGYDISGENNVTCLANGTWSAQPTCNATVCVNYTIPGNSFIEPPVVSGHKYQTNITVTCIAGYDIDGENIVMCMADGNWSASPICNIKSCPNYTIPENSHINPASPDITYGSSYIVLCDDGYEPDGDTNVTCGADATWSPNPECVEADCEGVTFNKPDNSKVLERNNTHLQLECEEGYNITGNEIVVCEKSRWSTAPNCTIVSCGELKDPSNGAIDSTGVTYLKTAILKCNQGFTPKNSETFLCLATGKWNDTAECELVNCSSPELPANAEAIRVTSTEYGTRMANITCKEGFETESSVDITCSETGNWIGVPSCEIVVCVEDPYIENGNIGADITISDREYGDIVMIICIEGYEVETNSSVKCEANGTWSGLKNCSLVDCGMFNGTLANGTVLNVTGTTFDERVHFECDQGFLLIGEAYITCLQNGSWGNPPICEEISCQDPAITHGTYRKHNGSIYEVECVDGFPLIGSNFIECRTDGSWNEIPLCKEVICANYTEGPLNGGIVKITGTRYGDTVTFFCDAGFNLNGSESILCDENGDWELQPVCEITFCGDPPVPMNGFLLTDELTSFNTTLYAKCNTGYFLNGSDGTTCGESGKWSVLGVCVPYDCGNITVFGLYKELTYSNGTSYGSVATIECAQNYTLRSEDSAVCTQTWNVTFICSSIGEVSFDMSEIEFTVGGPGIITCRAEGAENWTNLFLSASNLTLVTINRTEDTYINTTGSATIRITENTVFSPSSATLEVEISPVACTDADTYICSISITLPNGNVDLNFGEARVDVIDTKVEVPTLQVSPTTYNATAVVTCESLIGINSTNQPRGLLQLWSKLKSETEFATLMPQLANTTDEECNQRSFLQYSFIVNGSWDEAELKCVTKTDNDTFESETTIIAITGVLCDDLPLVAFGSVVNASTEDELKFAVVCDEGYKNVGDTNFMCTTSGWSGDPNCTLLDCGTPPEIDNAIVDLTNETTTTYNSIVIGVCENGYKVEQIFADEAYIVCSEFGNWNISFKCTPVECDNVTEPTAGKIVFNNGTIINSVLQIECDEGFNLVENYSTAVCDASGFWVRPGLDNDESFLPTCTIIGELIFDFESNITSLESNLTARCTLSNTPGWDRIGIFKSTEAEDMGVIAEIDRLSDNTTKNETASGVEILPSSRFNYDEVFLEIQITNVTCDNDGGYYCGARKGNTSEITEYNSLTEDSFIIVTSEPDIPVLYISRTSFDPDDEVELSCQGYVGQTSSRDSKAQLDLQIKYNNKEEFEKVTADITPEVRRTGCLIKHTKNTSLIVNSTYDGAVLRCVTDDGNSPLFSDNATLAVTVECNDLPTVEFGSVYNETTEAGPVLSVVCAEGYTNLGDANFTCTASGWSGNPNCILIDCGTPVDFNNTVFVLTNETTTYKSTIFGACENGHNLEQIYGNATYIVCGGDGNWNISFLCKPVECDNDTDPAEGSIVFSNGTTFNSVIEIKCNEGFNLVGNYSTAVCSASGVWVRPGAENDEFFLPTCTVIGELTFDFESNVTALESNLTARCTLLNTPGWDRIGIFRPTEAEDMDIIAVVDRLADNSTNNDTAPGVEILLSSYFNYDEALLKIQITNVTCENDGQYFCGALKGNTSEITDDNSLRTDSFITVTSEPEVPMLNIPNTPLESGDEVELTCQGYVGKTNSGDSKAQIDLQIKLSDKDHFETITSAIAPEINQMSCMVEHVKSTNITVNSTYDGAVLRCITDDDVNKLFSDNTTLTVTVECNDLPTVEFGSVYNETTEAGPILSVVCAEGYTNLGDTNFTCTASGWSGNPNCTLIDCGTPVNFNNIAFDITNETTTTYNSTVVGACENGHNVEQIYDNATYIVCGGDGNWNIRFSCKPVECDNDTKPTEGTIVFSNGTTFNSLIEIKCNEGFNLVGNYSTAVCSATGTWVRPGAETDEFFLPTCTVIGELIFDFDSNVTALESNLTARCTLLNTPGWDRIGIFRPTGAEGVAVVAVVDRLADNSTNNDTAPGVEILRSSYFNYDEALLKIQITNVTCENDGEYFCGALKGNTSEITDDNSLRTDSFITVTSEPEVPMLNIPNTSLESDDEVELTCQGYVGKTNSGDSKAQIDLQIKFSDKDHFETITSDIAPEINQISCMVEHVKRTKITVNSTYDGAVLRCITDDGVNKLFSDNTTLTVTVECNDLPTVEFGSVNNETTEAGTILSVVCTEGYTNLGDTNFTCTDSGWLGNPNCTLIDCGTPVDFNNIAFDITNETTTTYNSTVVGACENGHNVEQIYDNTTYIVCGGDGNWNISFSCKPVECDNDTEPTAGRIVSSNGTTFNSVIEIKCNEGFNLVGNYSTAVCSATGTWVRPGAETDEFFLPTCTVIGELTFDFESNVTALGSNLTARCTLLNTPGWDRIGIFRQPGAEDVAIIAVVDRLADNSTNNDTAPGLEILPSSYFNYDEAVLEIQITNVTCENDGEYFCGALKGNTSEITDNNSLRTDSFITVTSEPEVPMLNIPNTSLESDDEVELTCQGYVGKTSSGDSKAQIYLQIKFSDKDDFETVTSAIAPEINQISCMVEHVKRTNITVNSTYDGAVLRCITDDGVNKLFSDNTTLNVTDPSDVAFEVRAVAEDSEFSIELGDPSSNAFLDFQDDFCTGVAQQMNESDLREQYLDCSILSLQEGSIIITFTLKFQGDNPPAESSVKSAFTETADSTDTVQIGSYLIRKTRVEVIGITATEGSVSVLFTADKSIFNIGEAGALNINIQGTTAWEMISIFKTIDGIQTSIGNITESLTSPQFFSNHVSLSADSVSDENGANIIIDFEPVECDDDGIYTVEVRMNEVQYVKVDNEITVEYTPTVELTLPVEMREDRWTLNITCEAVFHSSVNRTLHWLLKREGETEFMEFIPEDIVEKPVEFRRNMSLNTNYDCLWNVKEDFDLNTTSADTWNNTQLRCALDYGTSEQVLSEVGTILLVPRSVCDDVGSVENVQNPLECTKRVQCNSGENEWGYVFATRCEDGTCWVGPDDSDCENVTITTTTTTTTPVPGAPYISCFDNMKSVKEGTFAYYTCELRNIVKVGTINISQDDNIIYSNSDEASGISGVLNISDGVTVSIDEDYLNVSIETSCQNEGLYQIEINNGSDAELFLALIADPEAPEISVPSNIYLNQRTDVTCTGNVGRDKDGNNAADLSFEIRKADSEMFEEVDGTISRLNEENNCIITQTANVSAYFEKDFNKSAIRCVAKSNDMVLSESTLYNISLSDPAVSFVKTDISTFIGMPFSLECNAENVANLSKLELTKEGTSLVVLNEDDVSKSEADVEIVEAIIEEGNGKLKVNFIMSKCSDKGNYTCEASTTLGVTFTTKTSVAIQRKPELPQLYPSLQIIRDVSPWADFPTQCYGEVGYPQGSISLQSNRVDNEFVNVEDTDADTEVSYTIVYTVDDEKCSTIGNITYYNKYTMDWDDTELRCVTRNSHIGDEGDDDGDFEKSLTKTIRVIPATFCDGMEDGPVPHPYYCYGRLTCNGNGPPIPFHLCNGNNTQCYKEDQSMCVDCESINMCDIGSTPAPTLPPGTPVMNCTKEVKGTKYSIVTVNCDLKNINVTLTILNSSNVDVTSSIDGNVVIDTATATLVSTSESESVYMSDPVTARISSSMINIEVNLTDCGITGDYTVRYNGNSTVEDDTNLVVTADAVRPVYSQKPNVFYAGQSVTVQCLGNVGSPAGNLSLIYKTSEADEWLIDEDVTTVESADDETCGMLVTTTREVDVTEDIDGYIYACEIVTQDNTTYRSDVKEVSIQVPVLLFGEAGVTAAIGDPLDIVCTWNTTILNASATISRSPVSSESGETLLVYEFDGDVMSQRLGISGSFQPGDEDSPNTLSLMFEAISCEDEDFYSCQLLVDDDLVAEAKKNISVTSNHSTPILTLPQQLVLNEATLFDSDHLKCTGSVGYPSDNSVLKIEYYSDDGQNMMVFDMGTLVENTTETDNCTADGVLSYRSITFNSSWNGTMFRCALYGGNDILETSDSQTLLLLENNCDAENNGQHFQHPYDCHLYTECNDNGIIFVRPCYDDCPVFNNNTLVNCGECSSSCATT